jgi:hypothetical protein
VTISKDAEIARSGYPETADEDPRRAAEAVGLFINDTIAVSTAPGDFRSNDQLRRNATALPPHVTMSHAPLHRHSSVGKSCWAGGGAGRGPPGTWVSTLAAMAYSTSRTSPSRKVRFKRPTKLSSLPGTVRDGNRSVTPLKWRSAATADPPVEFYAGMLDRYLYAYL